MVVGCIKSTLNVNEDLEHENSWHLEHILAHAGTLISSMNLTITQTCTLNTVELIEVV